jgi:hypothetical protein
MLIHVLFVITLVSLSLPYLNPCTVGNYLYPAPRMQQPATTQRSPSLVQPQPAQNDHHRPEDEMNDPNLEQLIDVGVTILNQALDFVNDSITSDEQLTVHSQYMPGSTIGTVLIPRSQGLSVCPIDT